MGLSFPVQIAESDEGCRTGGADLGETMGNIIASSYQLMAEIKPDAVLVLGDTDSCLIRHQWRLKFQKFDCHYMFNNLDMTALYTINLNNTIV